MDDSESIKSKLVRAFNRKRTYLGFTALSPAVVQVIEGTGYVDIAVTYWGFIDNNLFQWASLLVGFGLIYWAIRDVAKEDRENVARETSIRKDALAEGSRLNTLWARLHLVHKKIQTMDPIVASAKERLQNCEALLARARTGLPVGEDYPRLLTECLRDAQSWIDSCTRLMENSDRPPSPTFLFMGGTKMHGEFMREPIFDATHQQSLEMFVEAKHRVDQMKTELQKVVDAQRQLYERAATFQLDVDKEAERLNGQPG